MPTVAGQSFEFGAAHRAVRHGQPEQPGQVLAEGRGFAGQRDFDRAVGPQCDFPAETGVGVFIPEFVDLGSVGQGACRTLRARRQHVVRQHPDRHRIKQHFAVIQQRVIFSGFSDLEFAAEDGRRRQQQRQTPLFPSYHRFILLLLKLILEYWTNAIPNLVPVRSCRGFPGASARQTPHLCIDVGLP
ncbi:hypothetical protein SDC9_163049 [bioreactor metagenome]|uniref:Uncharacterized protein n=1 Tax=bioreactor metagenome TaxID=1076179 RepID=A0A645FMT1_9ZZZZ